MLNNNAQYIADGDIFLGIELGSTRIKAVITNPQHQPLAFGSHAWENQLVNNMWTYALEDVWAGLQACYAALAQDVLKTYGVPLTRFSAMGFSGMMHGYLAFNAQNQLLVPFRTWRNTNTESAAQLLSHRLNFNIPLRWSVAHLYQAVLDNEPHVAEVTFLTTLAGYVHWRLSGKKVLGIGDASGMFPINGETLDYDKNFLASFNTLASEHNLPFSLESILPKVLPAGENAGTLTPEGAKLLDPTGTLQAGVPMCPPEGDAGTGMVATNSVAEYTGNISAGTSIFSMVVLDKPLTRMYKEIDIVTTPTGKPVAMVHCNNCSSDIDAWAGLLKEFAHAAGSNCSTGEALDIIFHTALLGSANCAGLLSYNYYSGEPITNTEAGRPLFARTPGATFTLANFSRTLLYSAIATLKIGMDILIQQENSRIDFLTGHGGFFKAEKSGQTIIAGALNTPISVMETAGEGGPWGMAILAAFLHNKTSGQTLEEYLQTHIFAASKKSVVPPKPQDVLGFSQFLTSYIEGLPIEKAAISLLS